ncbi:2-octaprenyl-3-methyl-6-methoxy-1,4-benzoquinol hydroxylase [Marinomonas agarivorans]|nr:2-octaprenyl-3-methyl-6-methoxy-1,4-benzoquinol hydroxylase [Marinomonas agarivorans]
MARFDIVIIGGGMVGTLAANLLLKQGFTVALVDQASQQIELSQPPFFDTRVSAISRHSQRLLQQAGVWSFIDHSRLTPYEDMKVWDGLGSGYIEFSCDDLHLDSLGYLVENKVLQQALLKGLEQYRTPAFTGYFSAQVTAVVQENQQVSIKLNSAVELEGNVVIAADGANSFIRHQLNMNTKEWNYDHEAIVATIELDRSHESTAWQSFGAEGILAFLPMPEYDDRHFASIVWSVPPEQASALMALAPEVFCQRLNYAISKQFQVRDLISERQSIPLRQRHATSYVKGNVALVGDAAHTIHPLAGQGANLGFADVGALVAVLTDALQKGVMQAIESKKKPDQDHSSQDEFASDIEKILRRYQRQRMPKNIEMAATMEAFKRLYASQNPLAVMLRNTGMSMVNRQSWLKNTLIKQAIGEA